MVKTSKKDFERFKKEFLRWVDIFGLKDWEINFDRRFIEKGFAECATSLTGRIATITLTTELKNEVDIKCFNPEDSGKHEAIELLLAPLEINARYRYVSSDEIEEATHTIVRILEKVLK